MYDEIEIYGDEISTMNWRIGDLAVDNRKHSETFDYQFVIIDFDAPNDIIGLRRLEAEEMIAPELIYAQIIDIDR